MSVFWEIHSGLPREAPGDDESSVRALRLMHDLPAAPRILDIGCGPGAQTIALASHSDAILTAVDTRQEFLDELRRRADRAGMSDRIKMIKASMFELHFDETFDVIWSEGAIYIMGFEEGLCAWHPLLKPGGYVAVTELSWIGSNPPKEITDFWYRDYPGMESVDGNLRRMRAAGYQEIGHFTLQENSWWEPYYHPMAARVAELRSKYRGNADALQELDNEFREIEMYRKYSAWYGYVFYVMRG